MHLCGIVAKIFYCGGSSGRLGVLRAVMPFSDLRPLMSCGARDYVGQSFPELNHNTPAHAVIEIVQEEADASWNAGFYLFERHHFILRTASGHFASHWQANLRHRAPRHAQSAICPNFYQQRKVELSQLAWAAVLVRLDPVEGRVAAQEWA